MTILVFSILAFISVVAAQELGTAVLNGDVTDPQRAVVTGAQVSARNTATGVQRTTTTSSAGLFAFNNLVPGTYEVRVEAKGFAASVATVRLEVGQQAKLKFPLSIEKQQTTIEIDDIANAPLVNTVSSVVDGVVNAQQIDNLPLNGRNFLELALLLPGNSIAPNFDPTKANTVVISSAGQLGRGGSVTIDGSDDNDDAVGGMLLNIPEDAVQEFQSATNRFSSEIGRSGSSVVNVVTKSGSNTLHGSASVYERDKSLQVEPPTFTSGPPPGTPPFSRQQYAGTLGGPLVKNKAFWFGAFEYRDELGGTLATTRHVDTSTTTNSFAPAPLNNLLANTRGDWEASNNNHLTFRYSLERLDTTGPSGVSTPLASASQRQDLTNHFQDFLTSWTRVISPTLLNKFSFSVNNFFNSTDPVTPGPELDFPTITDGASFRVPQATTQNRLQWSDSVDWTHGKHNLRFGGEAQRMDDEFDLGVFQDGRIVLVEDFADDLNLPPTLTGMPFDRNQDGVVNDEDLLFAVTIRSGKPTQALILPNHDNNFFAGYIQDDWRVHPQLTLNLGLRYEIDTDLNNVGHYDQVNPILQPFLHGTRHKDKNNFGPRVGFNWATKGAQFSVHGGYGIYYDRITLEIESLERGLDGRALPIIVRLGNFAFDDEGAPIYLDANGHFLPGAPTLSDPFIGFPIPGAGAAEGIDVIDNRIQNPMVQQFNLGIQWEPVRNWVVRADGIHNFGTHFIIGVPVGAVFNPDPNVNGFEGVTQLQSAVSTHYDALWLSVDKRFSQRYQFHAAYTFSKALNYANDDQVPFAYPPVDPTNMQREYGPTPNDQRHRLVLQGVAELPYGFGLSSIWTMASGVPMDIMMPDNSSRVPQFGRNAGGRQFRTAAELNAAITQINNNGGSLPLVSPNARFNDDFNSFDLRLSKDFRLREGMTLQVFGEAFNLFNLTNILGVNTTNYSGFNNVLSSDFGKPVSTAGGVFGSGGPRAFQVGAKLTF